MPKKITCPILATALTVIFILAGLPQAFAEKRVVTTVEATPTSIPHGTAKVFKDQHGKIIKKEYYNHDGSVVQRDYHDKDGKIIRADSYFHPSAFPDDPPGKERIFSRAEYGPNEQPTTVDYYNHGGLVTMTQFYDENGHAYKREIYDDKGKVTQTRIFYYDKNGKTIKSVVLSDMDVKLIKAGVIKADKYGRPDQYAPPNLDKVIKGAFNSSATTVPGIEVAGTTHGGDLQLNLPGVGTVKVVKLPEEPEPPAFRFQIDAVSGIATNETGRNLDTVNIFFLGLLPFGPNVLIPGGDADVGTKNVEDVLRQAGGVQTPAQVSTPATTTPSISTLDTTTSPATTTTTSTSACPAGEHAHGTICEADHNP